MVELNISLSFQVPLREYKNCITDGNTGASDENISVLKIHPAYERIDVTISLKKINNKNRTKSI